MEFKQAIQVCLRDKYANFTGRASRSEFWWFFLFQFLAYVVLQLVIGVFSSFSHVLGLLFSVVYFVVALGLLVPALAVGARRLHDSGKSGWLQLLHIILFIGSLVVLVFCVLPSDTGSNTYGEPPAS